MRSASGASGKKISLGSTIQRYSGSFTVEDIGPADVQAAAGERFRLMREILAKVKSWCPDHEKRRE